MRKIAAVMALGLALALGGCSAGDAVNTGSGEEVRSEPVAPDGYKKVSVGDLSTFIPVEWEEEHDTGSGDLRFFTIPSVDEKLAYVSFMRIKGDGQEAPETEKGIETLLDDYMNRQVEGDLNVIEFDKTDEGIYLKSYFSVLNGRIQRGSYIFYDGRVYNLEAGIDPSADVDDPTAMMEAYLFANK